MTERILEIPIREKALGGILTVPTDPHGMIVFAHGSGSGRFSPRNQFVADHLNHSGFATLLFDLLTPKEEELDDETGKLRFNIEFLTDRLVVTADWLREHFGLFDMPFGFFGASTGAAAALAAATKRPFVVRAVVSRGGRPDLASASLAFVQVPTLLVVGGNDPVVLELNRNALEQLPVPQKQLEIVPDATHLFEEPGALEKVAQLASQWFLDYLL
ncbi:MAG: dienelactone hydrolase family protein [Candidatus Omnitrophica bacterium]|nr:dienelactone hydrolase family protein [Candidatus Omnitrophota bacterium]MDE2222241.1 dienelactone hydrolase family protein [Candidatus Omnitrophota bacterium]